MINVDWFQPYKHTVYSVGVIYLSILNLPRSLRFKRKNILLIGIIPGPSEPKHNINSFLDSLVDELANFWKGITFKIRKGSSVFNQLVRCALLCCSCDLPAGRKVCGFLGHSDNLGCSKCLKLFPGSVGKKNYSGFDRPTWTPRKNNVHRENVECILSCNTAAQQKMKETEFGCRYSALLRLPYLDPPRMLVIDLIHNLFLGSGKHMLHLRIQHGLIHYQPIQQWVDDMIVPSDVRRISHKIASGFSGFPADQYTNWITIFAIPCLYETLPDEHLQCWRYFVLACKILCKYSLTKDDIAIADGLLIRFSKQVEELYGTSTVTPNLHLHGHLKDGLLDYGSVYEFWLFSF